MSMFLNMTLSTWGDIGNIILGITSVFTAIVTAVVLCKQHKLQQEQHKLEQEKLKIQQMEHQPLFFFKREKDHMDICNSGAKLNHPIEFTICSMIYVQTTMFFREGLKDFVYCCPINIYRDCRCLEELDGVVGKCPFAEADRTKLHEITSKIWNSLVHSEKLTPKLSQMTSITVRESDLIAIKYQDVYHIDHKIYYLDSSPISEETYNKLNKIRQLVPPGIYSVDKIDLNNILRGILQFRFEKTW
jgi:hypothetical protein